jgi:hypothetical protein
MGPHVQASMAIRIYEAGRKAIVTVGQARKRSNAPAVKPSAGQNEIAAPQSASGKGWQLPNVAQCRHGYRSFLWKSIVVETGIRPPYT